MYDHLFFFFNDTATTEIYTLSLHDALPISTPLALAMRIGFFAEILTLVNVRFSTGDSGRPKIRPASSPDRKSTRLNSSHANISYAVFCLKKKKKKLKLYGYNLPHEHDSVL